MPFGPLVQALKNGLRPISAARANAQKWPNDPDDADKPDQLNESDTSDPSDESLMTSLALCPSCKK